MMMLFLGFSTISFAVSVDVYLLGSGSECSLSPASPVMKVFEALWFNSFLEASFLIEFIVLDISDFASPLKEF